MDELDFEYHKNFHAVLINSPNAETATHFIQQAKDDHRLAVDIALNDVQTSAIELSLTLSNTRAIYFARYGVGQRIDMIRTSYRGLTGEVPVDRSEPLSTDDARALSRDLNVIYINILGLLDNYARCLLHEVVTDRATRSLPREKIGLFSDEFLNDAKLIPLRSIKADFETWHRDMKKRRNPVAHGIPLSIPRTWLNLDQEMEYRRLETKLGEALRQKDFALYDRLTALQAQLGSLLPVFIHDPHNAHFPIYPTVPQDIGCLVKIMRRVDAFIAETKAQGWGSP